MTLVTERNLKERDAMAIADTRSVSAQAKLGGRMTERNRCPVFVMGCHRSGTNLLYDTLLSSEGFAVYRGLLPVHQALIPRFGRLDRIENRRKLLAVWF